MMSSRTYSQVLDSASLLYFSNIHTHMLYIHTGDSVCLDTGCVIQCFASCGRANPIKSGKGGGKGGGAVGSIAACAARSQDNLQPLHPGGMCL